MTMHKVKIIEQGGRQVLLLPNEFRVASAEVFLKRTPEGFLVITRDPWELFYEGVEQLSDDFMAEGRKQPSIQERKWNP
jgi:antitoxin VapB